MANKTKEKTYFTFHPHASSKQRGLETFGRWFSGMGIEDVALGRSLGERYISHSTTAKLYSNDKLRQELEKKIIKDKAFTPEVAAMHYELKNRHQVPHPIVTSYMKNPALTEQEYVTKLKVPVAIGKTGKKIVFSTTIGGVIGALGLGKLMKVMTPKGEKVTDFAKFIQERHGLQGTKFIETTSPAGAHFRSSMKDSAVMAGGSRAVVGHEFGHARNFQRMTKRLGRRGALAYSAATYRTLPLPGALGQVPLAGLVVLPFLSPSLTEKLKGKEEGSLRYKAVGMAQRHPVALATATVVPKLYEEASATARGLGDVAKFAPKGKKVREVIKGLKELGPAFGTYMAAASLPIGLGVAAAYMHKSRAKERLVTQRLSKTASFEFLEDLNPTQYYKNLGHLAKHKYYVYRAGREMDLPRWQLMQHDYTKLRPDIFVGYSRWLYGPKGRQGTKDPKIHKKFRDAVLKHYKLEAHHAHKVDKPKAMKHWLESVADSYSIGRTLHKSKEKYPTFAEWLLYDPRRWPPGVRREAFKRVLATE